MRIQPSKPALLCAVTFALVVLASFTDDGRFSFFAPMLLAHCDTMGGPVIQAAKKALETGDVRPVLIWVQKQDEPAITEAFQKTLQVRALDPRARELADMYFFETLVRVHRAGEGAPFTGLKPAGAEEPAIAAADKAVDSGQVDHLAEELSKLVSSEIKARFHDLMEKKRDMAKSVASGRAYVSAYVSFIHFVERLQADAAGSAGHDVH